MISIKKLFIALIILGICTTTIAMAEDPNSNVSGNVSGNTTPTDTATKTTATSTPIATQTIVTTQPTQTQAPTTVVTEKGEGKFRVGPTVRIRPLNDVISQYQDGLVELYMDNPSLNDVTLSVDARISVPSGIHVYGQSFGEAGAAGMVYGKFEIPPGSARTINIVIKAEKIGDFSAQFSGLYWPGENKDAYQPISLTHPFKVSAASKDPLKDTSGETGETKENTPPKTPGMTAVLTIFVITILAYRLRRT